MVVDLLIISLPNTINWFPKVIILCFLLHGIVKQMIKKSLIQVLIVNIFIILYIFTGQLFKIEVMWIDTVACYAEGMMVAYLLNKTKCINNIIKRNKGILFVISILVTMLVLYLESIHWYFRFLASILFSATLFLFTCVFQCKNKFLEWIGNHSFEFYLFHIIIYKSLHNLVGINNYIYAISVIIITIVTVYIYSSVREKVMKRCF